MTSITSFNQKSFIYRISFEWKKLQSTGFAESLTIQNNNSLLEVRGFPVQFYKARPSQKIHIVEKQLIGSVFIEIKQVFRLDVLGIIVIRQNHIQCFKKINI